MRESIVALCRSREIRSGLQGNLGGHVDGRGTAGMTVTRRLQSLRSRASVLYAAVRGDAATIAAMQDEEFRILAEHSLDVILRVGSDLRVSYASSACTRILGYAPEEMLGQSAQDFIFEDDLPAWMQISNQLASGSANRVGAQFRVYAKNRDRIWMEATAQLI